MTERKRDRVAAADQQFEVTLTDVGRVNGMMLSPRSNPVLVSLEGLTQLQEQGVVGEHKEV